MSILYPSLRTVVRVLFCLSVFIFFSSFSAAIKNILPAYRTRNYNNIQAVYIRKMLVAWNCENSTITDSTLNIMAECAWSRYIRGMYILIEKFSSIHYMSFWRKDGILSLEGIISRDISWNFCSSLYRCCFLTSDKEKE